jgi:hypothetical protein
MIPFGRTLLHTFLYIDGSNVSWAAAGTSAFILVAWLGAALAAGRYGNVSRYLSALFWTLLALSVFPASWAVYAGELIKKEEALLIFFTFWSLVVTACAICFAVYQLCKFIPVRRR